MKTCKQNGVETTHCPTLAPAILFTVLYTIVTALHLVQAILHKIPICWVLIMGGAWEIIGMTTRIAEITLTVENQSVDNASFVFILLAPLWINAFVYIMLGRAVWMYMPDKKLGGIGARRLGGLFIVLDISSFIVQLAGGLLVVSGSSTNGDLKQATNGTHVYTAGTCLQEAVILVFFGLAITFWRRMKTENIGKDPLAAKRLIRVLIIVLILIAYRVCFRIIEYAAPTTSKVYRTINFHEYFIYIFDVAPMFIAVLIFNVYHPGKTLQGPDANFPKLSKDEKRMLKEQKKELKQMTKADKHTRSESAIEMV